MGFGVAELAYYVLVSFVAVLLLFAVGVRLVRRFYHFPAPWFAVRLFDNPVRRRIQSPRRVVDRLGLQPGMSIVEVGPGAGTFTLEAARTIGQAGAMYAFDISRRAVEKLNARIVREKAMSVEPVVASAYYLPVVSHAVDCVFMVTVLAEIGHEST